MQCPACRHDNPPQAKFCLECGARLAQRCGHCGTELPQSAKFCLECGQPVGSATAAQARFTSPESYTPKHLAEKILTSKGALEGERKRVTVLFADLKGLRDLRVPGEPGTCKTAGYYVPQALAARTRAGVAAWRELHALLREVAQLNRRQLWASHTEARRPSGRGDGPARLSATQRVRGVAARRRQALGPELRRTDEVLEDKELVDRVPEALARRRPQSRVRGRRSTPAAVVRRMLVLKHLYAGASTIALGAIPVIPPDIGFASSHGPAPRGTLTPTHAREDLTRPTHLEMS